MTASCFRKRVAFVAVLLALAGCGHVFGPDSYFSSDKKSDEKAATEKKAARVPILQSNKSLSPDAGVDAKIEIPAPLSNKDWPQAGSNTEHSPKHLALAASPQIVWRASIGSGTEKYYRLLAQPVVSGGKVYALDSHGTVTAFDINDGDRIWRFDTTPEDRSGEAMGAGLAVDNGTVYVTSGFGEVLALKAADGKLLWRKIQGNPFRAAPIVAGDHVYAVTIDNQIQALSTQNGALLWKHNGIAESATLMGASSPAVEGDSVVVAYSSGEIFNLHAQNGRMAWTDVLAVPEKVGALPAIADIRGMPVIDRGRVYAMSHSGRMASIDQRTGDAVWEADIGGVNTPLVAGETVFVIDNENELAALARESGRVIWVKALQKLRDPSDRDSDPVFWWGPVLAGGRLWLTNSRGHLVAFDPFKGDQLEDQEIGDPFFIPPVVAGGMMFLLNDDGRLMALK
jgi:outer membrane protein assembly factor BamB